MSEAPHGLDVLRKHLNPGVDHRLDVRAHAPPISITVAGPAFQHSPMLGHLASSQTVASRCSRTRPLTRAKPAPVGARAFSHGGKRPATTAAPAPPAARLMPSRMAVKP